MSLASCAKCWDDICTCGWKYRDWSIEALEKKIKTLQRVIQFKRQNSKAKFSSVFNDMWTETASDELFYKEVCLK